MNKLTITLSMDDIQSALYFYEDLFPVDIINEQVEEGVPLSVDMTIYGVPFQLTKDPQASLADNNALNFTIEVSEEEVDSLFEKAIERDAIAVSYPSVYMDIGMKTAIFKDPFGFQWALVAYF